MKKKNDKAETSAPEEKKAPVTLDLDDLDQVHGGSIGNVSYTPTSDVSDDTRSNV